MLKIFFTLTSLVLAAQSYAQSPQRQIILEMKKIRNQLPPNDGGRIELTLRIADRLVDEAFTGSEKETKAAGDRREALGLYQEVLKHPASAKNSTLLTKVKFQMTRLLLEEDRVSEAMPFLKDVSKQSEIIPIKREALLRLAEIAERNAATYSEAEKYYTEVLEICAGTDTCSFAQYRLAWMDRNSGRMDSAIKRMTKALWDSKGNIREESLRDLIAFHGLTTQSAANALAQVDELSTRLSRPQLVQDLAYAYFSNGSRANGVQALALYHARHPKLLNQVRLLEEYYGLRNWDSFRDQLSEFQKMVQAGAAPDAEIEKICRRLATQLDGERTTDPSRLEDFVVFTQSTLKLFPNSKDRIHLIEGLVAALKLPNEKIYEIKTWLNEPRMQLTKAETKTLRELRAAIAQKNSNHAVVIEEMVELQKLEPNRKYAYAEAKARYDSKDLDKSLLMFQGLARENVDEFSIQSQNLALEILNQKKDLNGLILQADSWLKNSQIVTLSGKKADFGKEITEMNAVREQAVFELAVSRGDDPASLVTFLEMCKTGKYLPKSCDNAKVLSVRLKEHPTLLQVLKLQKNQKELISELEFGGYFNDVAQANLADLKAQKKESFSELFRISLLFELGLNRAMQVQTFASALKLASKTKPSAPEQAFLLSTAKELGLLNSTHLEMLDAEWKVQVAEHLEQKGSGNAKTKKILMDQAAIRTKQAQKYVVDHATMLLDAANKVGFYGKNGQALFKKRVAKVVELKAFSDRYLNGESLLDARIALLQNLAKAYSQLNDDILNSPMPAELNEEQVAQIKAGLTEMAKPFQDQFQAIDQLLKSEMAKVNPTEAIQTVASSGQSSGFEKDYSLALAEFQKMPYLKSNLQKLRDLAAQYGQKRIQFYFDGRLMGGQ